jgi:hypothetical protein
LNNSRLRPRVATKQLSIGNRRTRREQVIVTVGVEMRELCPRSKRSRPADVLFLSGVQSVSNRVGPPADRAPISHLGSSSRSPVTADKRMYALRPVASLLRWVASASGRPGGLAPKSPRSVLSCALHQMRRAAGASKRMRLARRFAEPGSTVPVLRSDGAFVASASGPRARPIAVRDLPARDGEWRQVGEVSAQVLHSIKVGSGSLKPGPGPKTR